MVVQVEGGTLCLCKLREGLVALEVEGGILCLCKLREGSGGCESCGRDLLAVEVEEGIWWLWTLRDGSVGCSTARDLAILFGCSQCSGSVFTVFLTLGSTDWNNKHFFEISSSL